MIHLGRTDQKKRHLHVIEHIEWPLIAAGNGWQWLWSSDSHCPQIPGIISQFILQQCPRDYIRLYRYGSKQCYSGEHHKNAGFYEPSFRDSECWKKRAFGMRIIQIDSHSLPIWQISWAPKKANPPCFVVKVATYSTPLCILGPLGSLGPCSRFHVVSSDLGDLVPFGKRFLGLSQNLYYYV